MSSTPDQDTHGIIQFTQPSDGEKIRAIINLYIPDEVLAASTQDQPNIAEAWHEKLENLSTTLENATPTVKRKKQTGKQKRRIAEYRKQLAQVNVCIDALDEHFDYYVRSFGIGGISKEKFIVKTRIIYDALEANKLQRSAIQLELDHFNAN